MKRPLILVPLALLVINICLFGYYFFFLRSVGGRKIEGQTLFCPVPKEYCASGKVIRIKGNYVGVGYQVPEGTPILAVLSGQVKGSGVTYRQNVGGGRYPGLSLTNFDSGLKVYYVLTGEDFLGLVNVDKGEQILSARKGEIANFKVNLLVSIVDDNQKEIELSPRDFVKK